MKKMERNYLVIIWKREFLGFLFLSVDLFTQVCHSSISFSDYRPIAALDRYDAADLDESDYDAISESGRQEAERMMKKRDKDLGVGQMRRGLFYGNHASS